MGQVYRLVRKNIEGVIFIRPIWRLKILLMAIILAACSYYIFDYFSNKDIKLDEAPILLVMHDDMRKMEADIKCCETIISEKDFKNPMLEFYIKRVRESLKSFNTLVVDNKSILTEFRYQYFLSQYRKLQDDVSKIEKGVCENGK